MLDEPATQISAGVSHTCALTTVGAVKCWGLNDQGQLGDNSTTSRLTAVEVSALSNGVVALAAGISHTCALTTAGGVKCWGLNSSGQLGDGITAQRSTHVDVSGLGAGAVIVASGYHTCAITTAGRAKCWGRNDRGQLGDNSTTN